MPLLILSNNHNFYGTFVSKYQNTTKIPIKTKKIRKLKLLLVLIIQIYPKEIIRIIPMKNSTIKNIFKKYKIFCFLLILLEIYI